MPNRMRAAFRRATGAVRAVDWWDYKFGPLLLLFYLGAIRADAPIASLWLLLMELLGAITASAIFVSVINDWFDRDEDRAAGKRNLFDSAARPLAISALVVSVAIGAGYAWLWRADPWLLGSFAGTWVAFLLYSAPPARWKARGILGVAADSAGSNVFPGLLALALASQESSLAIVWPLLAGCWIFAFGLRGILWHQLVDEQADQAVGVRTFVQRQGRDRVIALVSWIILPTELVAAGVLLERLGSIAPIIALLGYAALVTGRYRVFHSPVTLVEPKPQATFFLQEYYDTILPITVLLWSAYRYPADVLVLVAHLVLFNNRPRWIMRDVRHIAQAVYRRAFR